MSRVCMARKRCKDPPPPGKVCNPATGRWVLSTGRVGLSVLGTKRAGASKAKKTRCDGGAAVVSVACGNAGCHATVRSGCGGAPTAPRRPTAPRKPTAPAAAAPRGNARSVVALVEELGRLVGRGTYGKVYVVRLDSAVARAVRDLEVVAALPPPGTHVAVKVQSPPAFGKKEFDMHRYLADPGTCGAVIGRGRMCSAPLVPAVYAGGTVDGKFVMVMELVTGETLKAVLARTGDRLPGDLYHNIYLAMATLWAVGVSHNDFHPANIVVQPDGSVRVLDFGLAFRLPHRAIADADVRRGSAFADMVERMSAALAALTMRSGVNRHGNVAKMVTYQKMVDPAELNYR